MAEAKVAAGSKAKGVRLGGRKKGTPNKLNATVKMMILAALEKLGGEKYLIKQAKENPQAFMTLLGKIIPTQVVGDMSYRYVARMPPPEGDTDEWLKKYAPTILPQTTESEATKH